MTLLIPHQRNKRSSRQHPDKILRDHISFPQVNGGEGGDGCSTKSPWWLIAWFSCWLHSCVTHKPCIFFIHSAYSAFLFRFYSPSPACSALHMLEVTPGFTPRGSPLLLFSELSYSLQPLLHCRRSLSLQMFVLPRFSRSIKYVLLAIQGLFLGTLRIGTVTHIYISRP